jgi:hypothetical protein
MKIRDQAAWDTGLANNRDPYGACVYSYAKNWAELMEAQIAKGRTIPEIADKTSHQADTEGITGFMFGAAVSILARCWEHGEVLRRWHNLKTQIGTEGEEANKTGGVLNPALLRIGKK